MPSAVGRQIPSTPPAPAPAPAPSSKDIEEEDLMMEPAGQKLYASLERMEKWSCTGGSAGLAGKEIRSRRLRRTC